MNDAGDEDAVLVFGFLSLIPHLLSLILGLSFLIRLPERISDAANRLDPHPRVAQLLAQSGDMDVDGPVGDGHTRP